MTSQETNAAAPRSLWRRLRRPRLFAGTTTGIVVYVLLLFVSSVSNRLRFILAWDIGITVALLAMLFSLRNCSADRIRAIAVRQVTGKWTVLGLTVVAALASLVVIASEVPLIKAAQHFEQIARLTLVIVTIILSWIFINTIFALHYAHDYYLDAPGEAAQPSGEGGIIVFPGGGLPSYGDFVYFSFTIGMTFQVSDTQITDSRLRKLVVTHGIISFFYSTGILALAINLVAGLL